jgi:hypothetical protein
MGYQVLRRAIEMLAIIERRKMGLSPDFDP